MDELTAALESSFQVSNIPNNPNAAHPRFSQYKIKQNVPDQQERRKRILEQQKKSRFDFLSLARNLADNYWEEEDDVKENEKQQPEAEEESMEVQSGATKKPGKGYKDQLMLSEWMVDVPETLAEKWVMVPCPVGRRSLVVSSRGTTSAFSKGGYCYNRFPSLLPGGNRRNSSDNRNYCILDCLYSDVDRTYYVLDVMCWNGHPVYDSETDFRFYWSATKLNEVEKLGGISRINPYRFIPLPNFPCDQGSLTEALAQSSPLKLDGLLFYHKEAHYTFGSTPLVVWLKPFMLPEMLGVPVPENLLTDRPSHYTNIVNHVQEWNNMEKQKLQKIKEKKERRKKQDRMELGSSEQDDSFNNEENKKGAKSKCKQVKQETMETTKDPEKDISDPQSCVSEERQTENLSCESML